MTKVFIYGSLKKGFYNHTRWSMERTEFIGEKKIAGAKLFSVHGMYPCVTLTGDMETDIVHGEVYDIPDEILTQITRMEEGAGYSFRPIEIDGEEVGIFVFDNEPTGLEQIEDGVWK